MKSYTFTLSDKALKGLIAYLDEIQLMPGSGDHSYDEDEGLWEFINKIKELEKIRDNG